LNCLSLISSFSVILKASFSLSHHLFLSFFFFFLSFFLSFSSPCRKSVNYCCSYKTAKRAKM
jgi:hypothetical protein